MGWYRADLIGTRLAFTDRRGGVSAPPFDSLNLSFEAGPDSEVRENRRRAAELLGLSDLPWVPIRQVHAAAMASPPVVGSPEADAVVLASSGDVAAILVADCAPVAVLGRGGVAAVHAGWRGLVAGVVEAACERLRASGMEPVMAVLGPCIRPCCYEFDPADRGAIEDRYGAAVRATTSSGRPAVDLPAAVRAALGSLPVHDLGICTACSPDYFSYRRDGLTGRQALLATVLG